MRISDSMFYLRSKNNMAKARERLAEAQKRASTGMAVSNSSDDPVAYAQAQRETIRSSQAEHFERTINIAALALMVADDALSQVTEALQTVRDDALRAASDTVDATERADLALEVGALSDQVLALANTQAEGQYIFGGYLDNAQPFDANGNYVGHSDVQQVEVASGVKLKKGLAGDKVFGAAGGQDMFAALRGLKTALEQNDKAGVRDSLDAIEKAQEQIVAARSELGATTDSFNVARSVAQQVQTRVAENRSKLVEADTFDAASDLARAQQTLQIAVTVASALPTSGLASR
jgi:flagellar hook-associated protein 3 FlgL